MSLTSRIQQLEKNKRPEKPLGAFIVPAEESGGRLAGFLAREAARLNALEGRGGFVVIPAKGSI